MRRSSLFVATFLVSALVGGASYTSAEDHTVCCKQNSADGVKYEYLTSEECRNSPQGGKRVSPVLCDTAKTDVPCRVRLQSEADSVAETTKCMPIQDCVRAGGADIGSLPTRRTSALPKALPSASASGSNKVCCECGKKKSWVDSSDQCKASSTPSCNPTPVVPGGSCGN